MEMYKKYRKKSTSIRAYKDEYSYLGKINRKESILDVFSFIIPMFLGALVYLLFLYFFPTAVMSFINFFLLIIAIIQFFLNPQQELFVVTDFYDSINEFFTWMIFCCSLYSLAKFYYINISLSKISILIPILLVFFFFCFLYCRFILKLDSWDKDTISGILRSTAAIAFIFCTIILDCNISFDKSEPHIYSAIITNKTTSNIYLNHSYNKTYQLQLTVPEKDYKSYYVMVNQQLYNQLSKNSPVYFYEYHGFFHIPWYEINIQQNKP